MTSFYKTEKIELNLHEKMNKEQNFYKQKVNKKNRREK